MAEVKIPSGIVYGFLKPMELAGEVPLFTRVPLSGIKYPDEFRSLQLLKKSAVTGDNLSFDWVIQSVQVSLTRFWACSTAKIVLTTNLLDPTQPLKPPPVHPEMPLRIKLGYVDDLYGFPKADQLETVFTGYVDTVQLKLMPKRVMATITLRDPIRFLVDNRLTTVYSLADAGGFQTYDFSAKERGEAIKEIILDGSGLFYDANKVAYPAIPLERIKLDHQSTRQALPHTENGHLSANFLNILNRTPIEIIRHLSSVEGHPMELFADPMGNVHWARRQIVDIEDKSKIRHFWYRNPVTGTGGIEAPIIQGTMEWSSIGVYNEFVLVNASTVADGGETGGTIMRYGRVDTSETLGFDMATKTRFIFDDTLAPKTAAGGEADQEASLLMTGMFMLHSRDVRAGSIEVPGDAGMQPGMGIGLWNTGFFPKESHENLFRVSAVIHGLTATGPKAGFRTNLVFDNPLQVVDPAQVKEDDRLYLKDQKVVNTEDR